MSQDSKKLPGKPQQSAADAAPKRGRGRPRTIPDLAAYKAQKQREYRARRKAERESQ